MCEICSKLTITKPERRRSIVFILKSDSHLPKKFVVCLIECPLKIMENAFYVILKALFVLKIF